MDQIVVLVHERIVREPGPFSIRPPAPVGLARFGEKKAALLQAAKVQQGEGVNRCRADQLPW
jgi:hypothetical protein